MPTVDASKTILAAGAGFQAGDWASIGAESSLEFVATGSLRRGIDLGVGVEALARLDAGIRQYLTADASGQAHAAARVRAQVQLPMDLFDESGVAVRLQAIAEAAVGVQLGIGLDVGDFLALAATDPRMAGAPLELLAIFLDEFTIQGGVAAKAAAAAMAYANVVATGSLLPSGDRLPGFTVAAEAGVGLKAGAGFRVFARFGVTDPRRLLRRTIDTAVDSTLDVLEPSLPDEARSILRLATAPLKIGLRSAFELGAALGENGGTFAGADAGKLALRITQVALEELQRLVLERAVRLASTQLRETLQSLDFDDDAWNASVAARTALADRLRALPAEPFEATQANRTYWSGVATDALTVAEALVRQAPPEVTEPVSILWSAVQLLMKSVERISAASARVTVLGASPLEVTQAFTGELPAAPVPVRRHINAVLGHPATAPVLQTDAVEYLVVAVADRLSTFAPEFSELLPLLVGVSRAPAEAMSVVLGNIGAIVPGADGRVSAEATLAVLRTGLRTLINERIDAELLPAISAADPAAEIRLYLEEVLLPTLRTMVDTAFDVVLGWRSAGADMPAALRELCSGLLMRLFGRSLVVTVDVLLATAQTRVQAEIRSLGANVDAPGGVAAVLAALTGLDRGMLTDLAGETLEVCAEAMTPLSSERRARLRDLLYQVIDTLPPDAGGETLDELKGDGMVGDLSAATELVELLGAEIAGNVVRFVQALLARVARQLLDLLVDLLQDIQRSVTSWLADIEDLAAELLARLGQLVREIGRLRQDLDNAVDVLLDAASRVLGGFADAAGSRSALRAPIRNLATQQALDALAVVPGYSLLPNAVRRGIRDIVRGVVNGVLNSGLVDPVLGGLAGLSAQTASVLDDLRQIEPGDNLMTAVADIVLDRMEDALADAFGGRNPYLEISFDAPFLGRVDLGRVEIPLAELSWAARNAIRTLDAFEDALEHTVDAFAAMLQAESALAAAEDEQAAATVTKAQADSLISESRGGVDDVNVVTPAPGAVLHAPPTLQVRIAGGTAELLSDQGLAHRRVFAWVNGHELLLDDAASSVSTSRPGGSGLPTVPLPTVPLPTVPGHRFPQLGHRLGADNRGVPAVRDRAAEFDRRRRTVATTGPVAPPRLDGGIRARIPPIESVEPLAPSPSVLTLTIDVPAALLSEGVNAVAVAVVPGPAAKRIQRSVSFLYAPARASNGGGPTMPEPPVISLPPALGDILGAGGLLISDRVGPDRDRRPPIITPVPAGSNRRESASASAARTRDRLAAAADRRAEVRGAITAGALRPRQR